MAVRNVLLIMADQLRKDKLIRYDDGNCDFTDFGLRGEYNGSKKYHVDSVRSISL